MFPTVLQTLFISSEKLICCSDWYYGCEKLVWVREFEFGAFWGWKLKKKSFFSFVIHKNFFVSSENAIFCTNWQHGFKKMKQARKVEIGSLCSVFRAKGWWKPSKNKIFLNRCTPKVCFLRKCHISKSSWKSENDNFP